VLEIEFDKIKEKYNMLRNKIDEKQKKRNLIKTLYVSLETDISVYESQQKIIIKELVQKQIIQNQEQEKDQEKKDQEKDQEKKNIHLLDF